MTERSYQQTLVMARLENGLRAIESANQSLDAKGDKLAAASSAVVAVLAGSQFAPFSGGQTSPIEMTVASLLCFLQLVMYWYGARLWAPQPTATDIQGNVDILYDEYIAKEEDVAFNNALIDTAKCFELLAFANKTKGNNLRNMFRILQSQILVVACGVLVKAVSG